VKIGFKLDGKPLDLRPIPPSVIQVKLFLDKQKADDLFSTSELCKKTRVAERTLRQNDESLIGYSLRVGVNRYWGNPKAISELQRQVADEG